MTVALREALAHPRARRRLQLGVLAAILLIPALAIPFPLYAQALGNLFVPSLLLVLSLGWTLREASRAGEDGGGAPSNPAAKPRAASAGV